MFGEAAEKQDSAQVVRRLAMLWDQTDGQGFHGVVDLTEPFRCKDPWWNGVLDGFRFLQLTADTHAFLHGGETSVPGSWMDGRATCSNEACQRLPEVWSKMRAP